MSEKQLTNTYWNRKGHYQKRVERLEEGFDADPEVAELFAAARRFYYDYYNNGNCNAYEWDDRIEEMTDFFVRGAGAEICRDMNYSPNVWVRIADCLSAMRENAKADDETCDRCGQPVPREEEEDALAGCLDLGRQYEQMMDVVITYVWGRTRKIRRAK